MRTEVSVSLSIGGWTIYILAFFETFLAHIFDCRNQRVTWGNCQMGTVGNCIVKRAIVENW